MKASPDAVLEIESTQLFREAVGSPPRPRISPATEPSSGGTPAALVPAVVVGKLVGFAQPQSPLVDFAENKTGAAVAARSLVALNETDAGCEVALVFEQGNPSKPLILGRIQSADAEVPATPVNVSLDGEQVTLSARNEIVLRCGKASITLTRAGKIIIRGAYLLSRSSGVNRIKGGSVQIN